MTAELVDTPAGLVLSHIETSVVMSLAKGSSQKGASISLGLPLTAIANLIKRDGVREYIADLREARMMQMRSGLSEIVYDTLLDKVERAEESGVRLADTTRKDPIEIAKILSDILKGEQHRIITNEQSPFATVYQQINIIQGRK